MKTIADFLSKFTFEERQKIENAAKAMAAYHAVAPTLTDYEKAMLALRACGAISQPTPWAQQFKIRIRSGGDKRDVVEFHLADGSALSSGLVSRSTPTEWSFCEIHLRYAVDRVAQLCYEAGIDDGKAQRKVRTFTEAHILQAYKTCDETGSWEMFRAGFRAAAKLSLD